MLGGSRCGEVCVWRGECGCGEVVWVWGGGECGCGDLGVGVMWEGVGDGFRLWSM